MEQNILPTHTWKTFEHEKSEKSREWYIIISFILFAIIIYALFTDNPIMAITFILIGITGYLQLTKEPKEMTFKITSNGVQAGKELYEYDNMYSFWIFYEPEEHKKHISLHTKAEILPYVHIPLGDEDPVELRKMLLEYLPEEKHNERFIDTFEKFF